MNAEPHSFTMPGHKRQNRRPTIGLLIQSSAASPQLELEWQGVVDMARDQDANLICFIGGSLNSPHEFEAQANILYDLVNPEQLDGLVIWTSNVGSYITPEQVKEFLGRFHPLPMVSGAYLVPGIPSVLQSNTQGMREAIVHLSQVHGCRRIAFLRGPENHFGAQERYQAYIDALAEQGLRYSSDLTSPPVDWLEGTIAMAALLDERKLRPSVDFDAIVAASDDLMLAAMAMLQARDIRVPGQVAVIGCDNSAFCKIAMPPLTSVLTPSYELGHQAVALLLAQIHGEQIPEQTFVPGELIVRQSCGCLSSLTTGAAAGPVTSVDESLETALSERREHILNEMQRAVGTGEPARAWAGSLLDSFAVEMTGGTRHVFLRELEEILSQVTSSGGDILTWQSAISALRRQVLPYLERESRARAEDLWQQARVAVGEAAARVSARRAYYAERHAQTLREFGATLITTFDVDELMNVLAQGLPRLGIPSCYLAVYKDPQQPVEWSRLLLAYNEHGRIQIEPNGLRFPSRQLVPEDFLPQDRRYDLTIEPLYFRENQLGYIVFEVGPLEASIYEPLRAQISSALHGALLVHRVEKHALQLDMAVSETRETVKELEAFAYSVSHDLRAPLRHIDGFLALLRGSLAANLDERSQHYMDTIANAAKHMGQLIDDLLDFSRMGRYDLSKTLVDLAALVQDVIQEFEPEAQGRTIRWNVADLPTVSGDRAMLKIVLTNLISNALKFTSPRQQAEIEIGCTLDSDTEVIIFVRDNGVGFDMNYVDKLFGVFQRLHRADEFEGTGIGLANVRRIISRLGGRTWAEGRVDGGATFYFSLPQSVSR